MPLPIELINVLISSAAALIALFTGVLVWWQTRQQFRHSRSASYIERFNSEEYFNARLAVDRFSAEDPDFEAIIKAEVGKEPESLERARLHVLMFANIFQEIGAAYRVNLVDPRYTWSVFGFLAQYYWRRLSPFILRLRAIRNRPELYRDFEFLATEMNRLDDRFAQYKDDKFPGIRQQDGKMMVFAYGSLMNRESAAKTIELETDQLETARLYGFQRGWFTSVPVTLEKGSNAPTRMAFLALRKHHEAHCNGVLIPVSKRDLARLDLRERSYDRVDVTPLVFPSKAGPVFAYVTREPDIDDAATVVSSQYTAMVESAALSYGEAFLEEYKKSTAPVQFRITDAAYQFSDPEQNRAAGRD